MKKKQKENGKLKGKLRIDKMTITKLSNSHLGGAILGGGTVGACGGQSATNPNCTGQQSELTCP
jgi:hypothetical protein